MSELESRRNSITEPTPKTLEVKEVGKVENSSEMEVEKEDEKELIPSSPPPSSPVPSSPVPPPPQSLSPVSQRISKLAHLLDCGGAETIKELMKSPRRKALVSPTVDKTAENEERGDIEDKKEEGEKEIEEEGLDEPMEYSNLSDHSRNIWIVTTAALPWRTGTAINPFLRALYLIKRRLDLGLYDDNTDTSNEDEDDTNRAGKVTLVIPWLVEKSQSDKLYGPDIITESGDAGKQQQIEWIRNYADEKCGMAKEMQHLDILFYSAAYWPAFGSIFPSVDICSLIPTDEADVAILEEPEHLNWFRIPTTPEKIPTEEEENDAGPLPVCVKLQVPKVLKRTKPDEKPDEDQNKDDEKSDKEGKANEDDENSESSDDKKHSELGWAHKFTFVVGVIHTNYSAYMKQYGIGSSIIGAPAINSISSMVVRAYCHKVVRLSAVIPSYAKWKEITCNVHGVRGDFLGKGTEDDGETKTHSTPPQKEDDTSSPIYFIGKLLWAKGFDRMLKVQELYRNSNPNREYFPIDVYGSGPDETPIHRAFHGRLQNSSSSTLGKDTTDDQKPGNDDTDILGDFSCDDIFSEPHSIRKQLHKLVDHNEDDVVRAYSDAKSYINMGFEVLAPPENTDTDKSIQDVQVMERRVLVSDQKDNVVDPLSILSDVTENFAATGVAATEAMMSLADSAVKTGIAATFTQDDGDEDDGDRDLKTKPSLIFDPPKSLFELRRNPIPARFLGVKDHALLRETPHKIFLNPSVTEVLCTTTAEALAMGKFVIIPNHPSNEFFLQFPNCLPYKSLPECVEKISWALENEPTPLSAEQAYIFTWEAATDRLIESSFISKREARKRNEDGRNKADSRMAWLHSEGGKKGYYIRTLFGKGGKRGIEHEIDSDPMEVTAENCLNPEAAPVTSM